MDLKRSGEKVFTGIHTWLYRTTKGKIGGRTFKAENVLLTTTGRKSGKQRVTPLVATPDGDRLLLVASHAGAPTHPDWYFNVVANPDVTVQRGAHVIAMRARTADGDERAELWAKVTAIYKTYDDYQRKTEREIPIVICEPR